MSVRDTSLKAYINECAPTLGARQIKVLEVFEQGGEFTNAEIARALEWEINRVTGRVFELREAGVLGDAGRRKCSVTGRDVHAWKVLGRISPKAVSHLPNRYQMPSVSERGKTHKIAAGACDCKGFIFRGTCSHLDALARQKPKPEETMTPLF